MNCDSSVTVAEFFEHENNQARSFCASDLWLFWSRGLDLNQ